MKNKITYRNRFFLLLLGLLILIWLAFAYGFSKTIDLKKQLKNKKFQLVEIQDAPSQLKHIKQQLELFEGKLGKISGDESGTYLIQIVGNFCQENNLMLHEFTPKHTFIKDGVVIITQNIIVKGSFKNSLLLLSLLEENPEIGNLRSVSFESQTDMKSGNKELFVSYYLQSIQRQ